MVIGVKVGYLPGPARCGRFGRYDCARVDLLFHIYMSLIFCTMILAWDFIRMTAGIRNGKATCLGETMHRAVLRGV